MIGDNLPSERDKAVHVSRASEPLLTAIGKELGLFAERPLRQRVSQASYFVADAHRRHGSAVDSSSTRYLRKLLKDLVASGARPSLRETRPEYDLMNLMIAIRDGSEEFQRYWQIVLGLLYAQGIEREHWARIKALTRRFANRTNDEYLHLRPVAQLQAMIQEQLWFLIQNPIRWSAGEPSEEDQQAFFDEFANRVSRRLLTVARRRIADERHPDWQTAYSQSGTGSTVRRARIVAEDVYAQAAPVPQATPTINLARLNTADGC